MEDEEEKALLTIGDFFKVIFNRKWIVLAVTIAAIIIGTVLTMFVVNPMSMDYQLYFTVEYPGKGSVYPDGKTFRFQDMVSLEYLEAVKASDEKFANIDVEKLSKNDGIEIYSTAVVNGDDSQNLSIDDSQNLSIKDKLYEYRFVVSAKFFPDGQVANEFLRALASYPAQYNKSALERVDFKKELQSYSSVKTYDEKLIILNSEYTYLADQYKSLIDVYGDSLPVNGKSLSEWLSGLNAAYGSYDRQSLSDNLLRYGYIFDENVTNDSNDSLVYELQENSDIIEVLKGLSNTEGSTSATASSIASQIKELVSRNNNILSILNYRGVDVDKKTTNRWTWRYKDGALAEEFVTDSAAFGAKLDGIKANLETQATTCKEVMVAAYGQQAECTFAGNKLEELNKKSILVAAIISLIVGLVAVAVVVLIIDMPSYARKKAEEADRAAVGCTPVMVQNEQVKEAASAQDESEK